MKINGEEYDIDRDKLRLLIERDNPSAWIADELLNAADAESGDLGATTNEAAP